MITVGYSTRKHNPNFKEHIQKTCMYKEVQIIEKINNGEKSLSQVYNEILDESIHEIVVFCHDDLEFETNRWGEKLIKSFEKNTEYGILGLAGSKFLHESGQWWKVPHTMYGIVNHKHEGKKWTSTYSQNINDKIEETIMVDGLFFAINKSKIKHKFDESIPGFHFYDLGFCIPNYIDGVKIGVIFNNRVTHLSIGQTNQQWENNRILFSEKYKNNLPVDITKTEDVSETFIFVHDQDLILQFEENNKFGNIKNYKYVFLGKRDIDKIEDNEKVIVARKYENNLEDYPLFTSYTGWYILWKYKLITKKYVSLFEYDIVLNEFIEQSQSKFFYDNSEMIGYVPFPVSNFHFIENKNWVENIFTAIKKIYKLDIERTLKLIVSKTPNAYWSSTSNTTFKYEIFDEFMKWFEPIGNEIKETKTCGHAHERAISFFYMTKNKKMTLTQGLLQHLQMDSHKTQGHEVNYEKNINKLVKKKSNFKTAIVTLTRGYSNKEYYKSLIIRNKHILDNIVSKSDNDFDVIIYHEGNISNDDQFYISSQTPGLNLKFISVKSSSIGSAFDDRKNIINNELCPPTPQSNAFPLGYKHMCHFWSIDFMNFLKDYKYIIRIDEDCFVTKFNTQFLDKMESDEIYFASPNFQDQDDWFVIVGLEKLWNEFIVENNINPIKKFDEIKCPYTNFMIVNMDFLNKNTIILKMLDKIDKSHGIYSNRWGDLPIWGMILSTLVDEKYYTETKEISYFHGSHNKMIN
jgi:hypothetical protein